MAIFRKNLNRICLIKSGRVTPGRVDPTSGRVKSGKSDPVYHPDSREVGKFYEIFSGSLGNFEAHAGYE